MLPALMPASGRAGALLASWRGDGRIGSSVSHKSISACGSRGGGGKHSCWQGYAVLAAAVVLWLALMNAGLQNGDNVPGGATALRWSGTGATQLRDLGRLLLQSPSGESEATADTKRPFRWNGRNIATMVLAFAVGALANAVGIGGGAFFVPLFNILLGFSLKGSTALSQAIITGGAVASVGLAMGGRHPVDPGKPLIDYLTALMLTPVLLLGTSIGVLLNVLFPDWLLTFLLTALLLYLTARIARKSYRLHKAEKVALAIAAAASGGFEMQRTSPPADMSHHDPPPARRQGSDAGSAGGSRRGPGADGVAKRSPGKTAGGGGGASFAERPGSAAAGGPRRRVLRSDSLKAGPAVPSAAPDAWPPAEEGREKEKDSALAKADAAERLAGSRGGTVHGDMVFENVPTIGGPSLSPARSLPLGAADGLAAAAEAVKQDRFQRSSSIGERQSDPIAAFRRPGTPPLPPAAATNRPIGAAEDIATVNATVNATAGPDAPAAVASRGNSGELRHGPGSGGSGERGTAKEDVLVAGSGSNSRGSAGSGRPNGDSGDDREAGGRPSYSDGEGEKPGFPFLRMAEVFVLWGCFLGLQLGKSRFPRCSAPYFVLFMLQAVLSINANVLFTWQARRAALAAARHAPSQPILRRQDPSYDEPSTWGTRTLVRSSLVMLAGGSIAGLLGIGGGTIVSPLLLELGVHPLVAAATSSLMVLFSASTAALAFAFDHLLNITYALVYGIGCFVASLAGVWLVGMAVRRSGRASYVVIILACIIGLGAALTGAFGGKKAIEALASGRNIGFNAFC